MIDVTVSELRGRIVSRLESAKLRVRKLEDQLQLIDSLLSEEEDTVKAPSEKIIASPEPGISSGGQLKNEESIGRAITDAMRNIHKDDIFDVPTIAQIVMAKFPGVSYTDISKKASAKAYRLEHRKEIEIIEKGHGRTPHKYKRL